MDTYDAEIDFKKDVNPNSLYELTALLGEGSYGAVYRARSRVDDYGDEVAIKIIPDADDDMEALWREIRFLQVLRSPFVVSFIESLLFDNELWLVMELCDGGSLHDLKAAMKTTFNEQQLKYIIAYSVLGLQHLHAQMSIHRDVKSGNILITKDGRAKLGDFGISAQLTDTIMKRRTVIGSPYWMAPEVIQEASYDGKADIWSLGITLLELCEGNPPHFNVHPMRAIFIISSRPAPTLKDPSHWSEEMVDFVGRCLVKDCESRANSDELLTHPWIKKTIKEIGPKCCGSPLLQNLIEDNWTEIERIRLAKFKIPDNIIPDDLAAAVAAVEVNQNNEATINVNKNLGSSGVVDYDNMRTFDRNSFRHQKSINDGMEENMATWRRNDDFGIPATRQQVRNANLSRNSSRSTTPVNNRPKSFNGSSSMNAGTMRTLLMTRDDSDSHLNGGKDIRVSKSSAGRLISADFKYDAKEDENVSVDVATMKRGNFVAPATTATLVSSKDAKSSQPRYDSPSDNDRGGTMLSGSMIRTPPNNNMDTFVRAPISKQLSDDPVASMINVADGKNKGARTDLQSALKYFRDESVKDVQSKDEKASPAANSAVLKNKAEAKAFPPAAPSPTDVREMDNLAASQDDEELALASFSIDYKKVILKQLSSLKQQYRADLEELTVSYEKRRKALKDALHSIPTSMVIASETDSHTPDNNNKGKAIKSPDVNANRPLPTINKHKQSQHHREDPVEYY